MVATTSHTNYIINLVSYVQTAVKKKYLHTYLVVNMADSLDDDTVYTIQAYHCNLQLGKHTVTKNAFLCIYSYTTKTFTVTINSPCDLG